MDLISPVNTRCGVSGQKVMNSTLCMAPGGDNELEMCDHDGFVVTKPEAIHAELNCLLKAAREGVSVVGATLYTTLSCCKPCSEMVAAAGIKRVVYKEQYRDSSGIDNLVRLGVQVDKF